MMKVSKHPSGRGAIYECGRPGCPGTRASHRQASCPVADKNDNGRFYADPCPVGFYKLGPHNWAGIRWPA